MKFDLHHYVDFQGDFERPESFDEPSGEELADFLADALTRDGIAIVSVEGMDFAHYVDCECGASTIELMVGAEVADDRDDRWYVQPCRKHSFFGYKPVHDPDLRRLLLSVDKALRHCSRVSDVRWYPAFDTAEYLALMPYSDSPIPQPDYGSDLHPLIWLYWNLNQLTGKITHPLAIVGFIILVCVCMVAAPESAMVVTSFLFFTAFGLMTVVPFLLSILISREAQRLSHENG